MGRQREVHRDYDAAVPIMARPPKALAFIIGAKLAGLDTILPVAMELRAENPDLPIEFIFFRRDQYEEILGNYYLAAGLRNTGNVVWLRDRPGALGKVFAAMRLVSMMLNFLRRRTALFFYKDFDSFPYSWFGMAVYLGGGARINYLTKAFPATIAYGDAVRRLGGSGLQVRAGADGIVIYHPKQLEHVDCAQGTKSAVLGSPRSLPAWRNHVSDMYAKTGIVDLDGQRVDIDSQPCLAIFYPGNLDLPDNYGKTACRDQLFAILRAVQSVSPKALVLIKPHIICDVEELKRDRRQFAQLDIKLTFAHPQAVARCAKVALFVNGSHVMEDMYVEGVPIIETTLYAEHVRERGGSLFQNSGLIQACDEDLIADALARVLADGRAVSRFDLKDLYWPKPASLSSALWNYAR
jgi:hypothetical protein